MPIAIHPVSAGFAGEVSGIDIAKPLSQHDVAQLEAGMDTYAVLIFRNQAITDEQQIDFSRHFGDIENNRGGHITKPANSASNKA